MQYQISINIDLHPFTTAIKRRPLLYNNTRGRGNSVHLCHNNIKLRPFISMLERPEYQSFTRTTLAKI